MTEPSLTPKGEYAAMMLRSLELDGHQGLGLTDSDELLAEEGLEVQPGDYITCGKCGELWRL